MTSCSRAKIVVYLAAIFLAGGLSGGLISWQIARQQRFAAPNAERIADHFRRRLRSHLDLTPAQAEKSEPIIEQAATDIVAIKRGMGWQIGLVISNAEARIAGELSPEQKEKLAELERKRRALFYWTAPAATNAPAAPGAN